MSKSLPYYTCYSSVAFKKVSIFILIVMLFYHVAEAQRFVAGKIITSKNDTISSAILTLKKRGEEENSRYVTIQISDSLGTVQTLYPKDILAYIKDGVVYKSGTLHGKDIFMKLLVSGKASLYYYTDGYDEKYFFKRKNERDFVIMDNTLRFDKVYMTTSTSSRGGESSTTPIIDRSSAFISYMTQYFSDCSGIVSKVKSEFYSKDDIVDIFKEYNKNCGNP